MRTVWMSGPLKRYWIGRPTGGPISSELDQRVGADEFFAQDFLQLLLHAVADFELFGHDDDLAEIGFAGCTSKDSTKRAAPWPI